MMVCGLLLAGCGTSRTASTKATPGYEGTWLVEIDDTPLGDVNGELKLMRERDTYTGTFKVGDRTYDLRSVNVSPDEQLSASFYFPEYSTDVNFVLRRDAGSDTVSGKVMEQYDLSGRRKG